MENAYKRRRSSITELSTCLSHGAVVVTSEAAKEVLQRMNYFRKNGHFDIILKVGSRHFYAHKYVLAAFSDHFKKMFMGEYNNFSLTEIKLEEFDENIFEELLNYIYCARIEIDENNISKLLHTASLLQSRSLLYDCSRALESQVNIQNCLGMYFRASSEPGSLLKQLEEKCLFFIKSRFNELAVTGKLQKLEREDFIALLKGIRKIELSGHKEEVVLDAVMDWFNLKKKLGCSLVLSELLSVIDLPSVDLTYLRRVVELQEDFNERLRCMCLINEALPGKVLPSRIERSRISGTLKDSWIQGVVAFSESCMKLISGNGRTVRDLKQPPFHPRTLSTLLSSGHKLYVAVNESSTVWCYNTVTDQWTEMPAFPEPRYNFALAKLFGNLYAIGGQSVASPDLAQYEPALHTVLKLDEKDRKWVFNSTLARGVQDAQVVTTNGTLYAVGGFSLRVRPFVQEFDPDAKTWTVITRLPITHWYEKAEQCVFEDREDRNFRLRSRSTDSSIISRRNNYRKQDADDEDCEIPFPSPPESMGICGHDGGIYVIGGETVDGHVSRSVFFFDPSTNRWWARGETTTHMSDPIIAVINGSLTVFGTQNCGYNTIEKFSSWNYSWKVCGVVPDDILWGDGPILIPRLDS